MTPGTVLFDPNFEFEDGTTGRKLFVVLNNGSHGEYLVVKTTSNPSRYSINFGCNNAHRYPNFFLPRDASVLSENTWIQLEVFYPMSAAALIQKTISGEINRITVLSQDIALELIRCAKESWDIPIEWAQILEKVAKSIEKTEQSQ